MVCGRDSIVDWVSCHKHFINTVFVFKKEDSIGIHLGVNH